MGNAALNKTRSKGKLERRAPTPDEACQKLPAMAVEFSAPFTDTRALATHCYECRDCLSVGTRPSLAQPQGHVPRWPPRGSALHTLLEREWEGMKEIRQISPQENESGGFP